MRIRQAALIATTVLASSSVFAADYPVLRGTHAPELPPPPMIEQLPPSTWDGFYVGGFAGWATGSFTGGNGRNALVQNNMRFLAVEQQHNVSSWLRPPEYSARAMAYGAFAGVNWAFGEAVIGLEADYFRFGRGGTSTDVIGRQVVTTAASTSDNVNLTGTNASRLDDVFTIRGRLGYAMGNFMPYVTGGLAIGTGRVSNSARVLHDWADSDPTAAPVVASGSYDSGVMTSTRTRSLMTGFTIGAGAEAMFGGLILRGEYLYTRVQGQGGVTVDMNVGRFGAGVKF